MEFKAIRASALPIIAYCPKVLSVAEQISEIYEIANAGRAVHKVCEEIVKNGDRPEDLKPYAEQYGCDIDFLGRATWYALQYWREYGNAYPDPYVEYSLQAAFGRFILTGHVDVLSIVDNEAHLLDWKSGYRTEVDVEPQMKGYAYLAASKWNVKKVIATVVWLQDQTFQSWTWTAEELGRWAIDLSNQIISSDRHVVGEHCRYCPAFFNCPAQKAIIRTTVEDLLSLDEKAEIEPSRIARLYPAVERVARLCETFRRLARQMVEKVGNIPIDDENELTIVSLQREKIEPLKAWGIISEKLDDETLAKCVSINKGALLRAVADNAPRGQKGKERSELMEKLRSAGAIEVEEVRSLRVVKRKEIER